MINEYGGQSDPLSRPICPLSPSGCQGDNKSVSKADKDLYLGELAAIKSRIRMAREATGNTQASMAKILGIKLDAYKKYENRSGSSMPIVIFARFCESLGRDPYELLMGKRSSSRPAQWAHKAK